MNAIATITGFLLYLSVGGVIARAKGDYFSRGCGIQLLAGFPGTVALLISPRSKARDGDVMDEHGWPKGGGIAFLVNIVLWVLFAISR
jgi:hypothetical protein